MAYFQQFTFKQFGYLPFREDLQEQLQGQDIRNFIKIVYLKAGGKAVIDFKSYTADQDALFFINPGQYFIFDAACSGTMLYYNRDFYCVEIHDKEVACDGILFHNVYEIPVIFLDAAEAIIMQQLLANVHMEFEQQDSAMEEMLRIILKTLIIKATRLWKKARQISTIEARQGLEFSRQFSQLVEWHYSRYHTVAEYAELLHITPKALNKRITRYSDTTPNDIIKNRIILEAKRLLIHTTLSVKEIGYKLGYDDPSYFIRLFTKQAGSSPQHFRQEYQQ